MATKRLSAKQIASNTDAFSALKTITGYKPSKKDHSVRHGDALHSAMLDARAAEVQAEATVKEARGAARQAEQAFHAYLLGVKDYVTAEYGASSDELQRLGLKKKSDYKHGGGRRKKGDEPAA